MRLRLACVLLILAGICGCGTQSNTSSPTAATTHTYNGTASVGDFLTITIDTAALTISYSNLSNGDSGIVPYTVNANGSFSLSDPSGNLIAAYEVPGYALVIEAAKAGPNHNTPALITAVESGPISMSTFANNSYNYMQFRTSSGGLEVGSVTIGATSGQNTSYWPYGALNAGAGSPFNSGTLDFSGLHEASSGTYLSGPEGGSGSGDDYIFGTSGGFFIVDTPNGSILGLQKAATAAFDPLVAGTYSAIYYQKVNASTGQGNVETGTASTGQATIVITAAGGVTITDAQNNVVAQATLIPVSSASYLYGSSGELADPCNGLFTFRVTTADSQEDVFVTFVNNAVVFSTFSASLPWTSGSSTYNYQYGVGLK
ncbi:MAG: hypothetical protein WBM14_18915 [Terracidiphilus sp.]|jgi:hypothetical protein